MNKSIFVDVVGLSTLRSGTWKESYPPVCLVIHKQSLVRAVKPREPANLPRPLWLQSGKHLESTDMGRYTSRRENCVSPVIWTRDSSKTLEQKIYMFCHSRDGGKRVSQAPPHPQRNMYRVGYLVVATLISGERQAVNEYLVTAVGLVMAGGTQFSPQAPRSQRQELHDLRREEIGEKVGKGSC